MGKPKAIAWIWWVILLLLGDSTTRPAVLVQAQQRGPITVHFVNDSGSKVDIIWTNHLQIKNGELVATQTGPLPARSKQTYRAYVSDNIELRQVADECAGNYDGRCKSAMVRVIPATEQDVQSNIFILSPDFQATVTTSEDSVGSLFGETIDARMRILNHSGHNIRLFWVNPVGLTLVPMSDTDIANGGPPPYFSANVFHQFQIQQSDGIRAVNYRVTDKDIDVKISSEFEVAVEPTKQETDENEPDSSGQATPDSTSFPYQPGVELFDQCQWQIIGQSPTLLPAILAGAIENCIRDNFDKVNWGFDANVQTYINYKMEDYMCSEPRMETTEPIETRYWTSKHDQLSRYALVLHENEASSIHLIPKFVSREECEAMEQQAEPHFEATKTTDAHGRLLPNMVRKAIISPIEIPWEKEKENDPVAKTGRRIFDYVQHVLPKMHITHEGQEPLMAIHYHGRGKEDPYPDQYKSHFDTGCTGRPIQDGQRVATMVMYCATPEEGGHTNFRNAHVHIKPEPGMAVFFTYANPNTKLSDDGMSLHAGCPVYKGAKKIVTQWIRYGVDNEHSHTEFSL